MTLISEKSTLFLSSRSQFLFPNMFVMLTNDLTLQIFHFSSFVYHSANTIFWFCVCVCACLFSCLVDFECLSFVCLLIQYIYYNFSFIIEHIFFFYLKLFSISYNYTCLCVVKYFMVIVNPVFVFCYFRTYEKVFFFGKAVLV